MDSIHNRFQDIPKLSGTNNWSVVNAMPSSNSRTKKLLKNQQINKMEENRKKYSTTIVSGAPWHRHGCSCCSASGQVSLIEKLKT